MTRLDQDVADILGVTSESLAPSHRRGAWRKAQVWSVLGASVVAISIAALGFAALHRGVAALPAPGAVANAAPASRPRIAPDLAPPTALMQSASADGDQKKAEFPPRLDAAPPPLVPTELPAPPPPPPPDTATMARIRASEAPVVTRIEASPRDVLNPARTEKYAAASSAPRLELDSRAHEITPVWVSEPSGEAVERAYPPEELRDGVPGAVVLSCLERQDGTVNGCRVLDEQPFDSGFGRAALRLSHLFRFTPYKVDGRPTEIQVRIPYEFAVAD